MTSEFVPTFLDQQLGDYYAHLYPSKLICQWLAYGEKPNEFLARREFAFIFKDDAHHRYQTFTLAADLQSALTRKRPHKIDFGAVYNAQPKDYKSTPNFKPVQRELVFDIDLTDYDDVRGCCKSATVCQKCWKFIVLAAKILNVILRDHFGFRHMLWIFSGRRGMHCWVADESARRLENNDRAAVASYLTFRISELPYDTEFCHPYAADVYDTIMQSTEINDLVIEQQWLSDENWRKVLDAYCKDSQTREFLSEALKRMEKPETRWQLIKDLCDQRTHEKGLEQGRKLPEITAESTNFLRTFVLDRLNPRLDANVTTATNHLLKSPFCVHPKTGLVAVPFNVDEAADFRIENVPRIDLLVAELHQKTKNDDQENRKTLAYKHTALAPWIKNFEVFIKGLISN
ncbi:DNA primase domain containing protein [Aphelenchoides besseyi]|nr:DNA primase domain containing protein [Aphelenchoides besseyi]KAI6211420.1 DNA primase domain containing protein [Aphelenchoides besseyi]